MNLRDDYSYMDIPSDYADDIGREERQFLSRTAGLKGQKFQDVGAGTGLCSKYAKHNGYKADDSAHYGKRRHGGKIGRGPRKNYMDNDW